jgi:hypothetical protein
MVLFIVGMLLLVGGVIVQQSSSSSSSPSPSSRSASQAQAPASPGASGRAVEYVQEQDPRNGNWYARRANDEMPASTSDVTPLFDVHALTKIPANGVASELRRLFPKGKVRFDKKSDSWDAKLTGATVGVVTFKSRVVTVFLFLDKPARDRAAILALMGLQVGTKPPQMNAAGVAEWRKLEGFDEVTTQYEGDQSWKCAIASVKPSKTLVDDYNRH